MRLISCHIENFGRFTDFTLEFTGGCNVLCRENGWGKSTLAAFIKVMLFGFDNEKKRDSLENERKKYKPWQGGVYGGQLTLEAGGICYTLFRTFGDKEKDDRFELRRTDTNQLSSDYSKKIGEELFEIDSISFARTVYIVQNRCETGMNARINAKIEDLAGHEADISSYDEAAGRLNDILNKMSPSRKTGELWKKKQRISELEEAVKNRPQTEASLHKIMEDQERYIGQRKTLEGHKEELKKQQRRLGIWKDRQAKRAGYDALCREYMKRKADVERTAACFPGEIPQEGELSALRGDIQRLREETLRMARFELSAEEEERLAWYDRRFAMGFPAKEAVEERTRAWSLRTENQMRVSADQAAMETLRPESSEKEDKRENAPRGRWSFAVFFAGILLILLGVEGVLSHRMAGLGYVAVGILFCLFCLFWKKQAPAAGEDAGPQEDAIHKLEKEIEEAVEAIRQIEADTKAFFAVYGIPWDVNAVVSQLEKLKKEIGEYETLSEKQDKRKSNEAQKEIKERKERILAFFGRCFPGQRPEQEQYEEFLRKLETYARDYQMARQEFQRADDERKQFEREHPDFASLIETEIPSDLASMEELDRQLQGVESEIRRAEDAVLGCGREEKRIQAALEETVQEEERLGILRKEYQAELQKYERLKKTRELLEEARENLTARYMAPLMEGFQKYYRILTGTEAMRYRMDASVNLTLEEWGMQRDIRSQSSGLKDVAGICMRMALVDAMYPGEKPFVIFDDPFVNLDEEKTAGGLAFLEQIGKEYQILYFTCHRSRTGETRA